MSAADAKLAVGLAIACAALGCSSKDAPQEKRLTRNSDRPPVVIIGQEQVSKANAASEAEPNDDAASALPLSAGIAGTGVLAGSDDVDRFSFVAPSDGLLFATASGGGKADLTLTLADANGEVLAKSDRGPAGTAEGIAGYGVTANQTYQLVVAEFVGRKLRKAGGRKGDSEFYRVDWRVDEEPEPGFEREPNAEADGASELRVGEELSGYIGWGDDVDRWRLSVGGAESQVHLSLSAIPGVSSKLVVLGAGDETLLERQGRKGEELAIRNLRIPDGVEEATVLVSGKSSNPKERYILRLDSSERAPGMEQEPNDSLQSASELGGADASLVIGRGDLSGDDVDHHQLAAVGYDRILELRLSGSSQADLDVTMVAESGAVVATAETAAPGSGEALSQLPVPAGSRPIFRVSAKSLRGAAVYELSLSLTRGTAPPRATPEIPAPAE